MLSFAGGVLGVALAWAGVQWLQALQPPNVPRLRDIGIDWRVLLFYGRRVRDRRRARGPRAGHRHAAVRSAAHALGTRRADRRGGGTMWGRGGRLRRVLVVAADRLRRPCCWSAPDCSCAPSAHLQRVPPGFDASRVLTLELTITGQKYPNGAAVLNAYADLWTRLETHPRRGVGRRRHVAAAQRLLGVGPDHRGRPRAAARRELHQRRHAIGPATVLRSDAHPAAAGPVLQRTGHGGRDACGDRGRVHGARAVARAGPDRQAHPLRRPEFDRALADGRRRRRPREAVRARHGSGESRVYLPHTQRPGRSMYVALRTTGEPEAIATAVRQQIRELDPNLPIYRMRPMTRARGCVDGDAAIRDAAARRVRALALSLAAIGITRVMAHVVSQGTREMGIRLALGATSTNILGMVLRHGLTVAAVGIGVGLAAAAVLTRLIATLIFGVRASGRWRRYRGGRRAARRRRGDRDARAGAARVTRGSGGVAAIGVSDCRKSINT